MSLNIGHMPISMCYVSHHEKCGCAAEAGVNVSGSAGCKTK